MPFWPAGRVRVLFCEGWLKAMRLHIGFIHEVDAVLVAQLIPALPQHAHMVHPAAGVMSRVQCCISFSCTGV